MSDFHLASDDQLDRWLADQHQELLNDLAGTLDVDAGLGEILLASRYDNLVADLDHYLDVDAGLAAIVPPEAIAAAAAALPAAQDTPMEPATQSTHAAASAPAAPKSRTRSAIHLPRVITRTGLRDRLRSRSPAVLIAAAMAIGLTVTIPAVAWRTLAAPPPTAATSTLDILHYEVSPPSGIGTMGCAPGDDVRFTFTVIASGAGTVHAIWQPDEKLSNLPVRDETITFTGPKQTRNVAYTAPYNPSKDQQFGMRVTITSPADFQGASYYRYDCPASRPTS